MIETKELAPLKAQVSKLENQANAISIETKEEYIAAADLIAKLKETGSKIKYAKESITKPLNEALKNARNLFAPIENQFAKAESIVKQKLLTYKRKADEEARLKEEKIAKQVEDGKIKLETAERKIEKIETIETTTRGKVGEVQVRKIKKVRIVDAEKLPRAYLIPNESMIRRDALSGSEIPGGEVYEEEVIAAGRI